MFFSHAFLCFMKCKTVIYAIKKYYFVESYIYISFPVHFLTLFTYKFFDIFHLFFYSNYRRFYDCSLAITRLRFALRVSARVRVVQFAAGCAARGGDRFLCVVSTFYNRNRSLTKTRPVGALSASGLHNDFGT